MSGDFRSQLAANLTDGIILVSLLFTVGYLWYRQAPQNYYTRIATVELVIAIGLRLVCALTYFAKYKLLADWQSAMLFDYRFEVPFYIICKIQFGMLFGWITLQRVVQIIQQEN